jgi:hypothetical protein
MWIPQFLLSYWEPESAPETIERSRSDTRERAIDICFILEDPPARLEGVALRLKKDGLQSKETSGKGRDSDMWFRPDKDGRLEAIIYRVKDTVVGNAFLYAHDNVTKLLSIWAVAHGTGFSIRAVRVMDVESGAMWWVSGKSSIEDEFGLPAGISLGDEHATLLSLYREGRNAISPFYRFLCFYKIFEAWYKQSKFFGRADRLISRHKLSFRRPKRVIEQHELTLALIFKSRPELLGVTFGKLFELMNPLRVKVAHALTDDGDFINFDKYESQTEIGPVANLLDVVSRQLILDELDLWKKIVESGTDISEPDSGNTA